METTIEVKSIGNHAHIRLTKKYDRVVGIEIYATESQRRKILDTFPDKVIAWKEAAPHYLLLNQLANYQRRKLTQIQKIPLTEKEKNINQLVTLIKNICHASAPLYQSIHSPQINFSDPLDSLEEIKNKIQAYQKEVDQLIKVLATKNPVIEEFRSYHQAKCKAFIEQLDLVKQNGISKAELRQLVSNQDQVNLDSLGTFLRTQATHLASDSIAAIDEITAARFEQLFSATAHPLRKALVFAKSDLEKQRTAHAVRYLNAQSPLPDGQFKVLEYKNQIQEHEIDTQNDIPKTSLKLPLSQINSSKEPSRWMNIMPYVKTKTFLGEGLDGSEGLDDVDQLLTVYSHLCNDSHDKLPKLEKPSWLPYRLLTGQEYGAWGIAAVILLGLPAGILLVTGVIAVTAVAIAIDLSAFLLQVALFFMPFLGILLLASLDFFAQIPSIFSQRFERNFSFLVHVAHVNAFNNLSNKINHFFHQYSIIRQLKQWLLEQYAYYKKFGSDENKLERAELLNEIRNHQSEGFFNQVASQFFNFATIAQFFHQKIKQLAYAARELRKVAALSVDTLQSLLTKDVNPRQKAHKTVIDALTKKIKKYNDFWIDEFNKALTSIKNNPPAPFHETTHAPEQKYSPLKWHNVGPWHTKHYETPLDPLSDIGLGITHQLVDSTFEHNPGVATPTFLVSLMCGGAFLFPTLGEFVPYQIINSLGFVPQILAKSFMGKSLEAGLSNIATKIISIFLQWELTYFSIEAASAIYHGDLEWIKKIFENPEEITLASSLFISMGYGVGLIPQLPTDISILNQPSNHPFFNALTGYVNTIYSGFSTAFNVISEEAREVSKEAASGLNILELAFIGLKGSLMMYGLISGIAENTIVPLSLDTKQLVTDFIQAKDEFEQENLIGELLSQYGISDSHSHLAKEITKAFREEIHTHYNKHVSKNCNTASIQDEQFGKTSIEDSTKNECFESNFKTARNDLTTLIQLICDMETLGISIDLDPENLMVVAKGMNEASTADIETTSDPEESESGSPRTETTNASSPPLTIENQPVGYQSKVNAELLYDALFFAIEKHNQEAQKLGLFSEQIDGSELLHNFYNKHCYTGSSGWHKILFGILLFPLTWAWRGIKYLVGTPAVRHQVKKSFSKDFAMIFQLIPDVMAPMLRSFLKAAMYAIRMVLGVLVLLPLTLAIAINLVIFMAGLTCTVPWAIRLSLQSNHEPKAQKFVQNVQNCFDAFKATMDTVWNTLLHNSLVNDYIALVAKVGSTSGTGSPHRINFLKLTGISAWYAKLTACADTRSDQLEASARNLLERLKTYTADSLLDRRQQAPILEKLAAYDTQSKQRWLPRSSAREKQLEQLSYQALFQKKTLPITINSITTQLNPTSQLRQCLPQN